MIQPQRRTGGAWLIVVVNSEVLWYGECGIKMNISLKNDSWMHKVRILNLIKVILVLCNCTKRTLDINML